MESRYFVLVGNDVYKFVAKNLRPFLIIQNYYIGYVNCIPYFSNRMLIFHQLSKIVCNILLVSGDHKTCDISLFQTLQTKASDVKHRIHLLLDLIRFLITFARE